MNTHNEVNGTSYKVGTNEKVIDVLDLARLNNRRITIEYGRKNGQSNGQVTSGYVGRSMGRVKVPLLIYNKRCVSGMEIDTDYIVAIYTSKGKKVLYLHDNYRPN